jgi:hypothetical protein
MFCADSVLLNHLDIFLLLVTAAVTAHNHSRHELVDRLSAVGMLCIRGLELLVQTPGSAAEPVSNLSPDLHNVLAISAYCVYLLLNNLCSVSSPCKHHCHNSDAVLVCSAVATHRGMTVYIMRGARAHETIAGCCKRGFSNDNKVFTNLCSRRL